ncbi:NusG domain II-containing protein [Paenibacillus thiaminolyticus]|uniref:NusG domain II-containing protein n=1 Tax=Paenibacillus thiaminolyticus TaxID=49283 RepID=UPI002330EE18|nr:NusG domain II-containing protein [Paenibacillus thiaminolyticus]WCF10965.1 NusG domain II-containing protein [Paenibacillus thiaminolyticus]
MWKKLNLIKLKTGDYILISILLLVAVMIYGVYALQPFHEEMPAGEAHAQIQVDGEIYQTVKLTKETQWIEIRTDRGYDVLRVRDYGIEVVESDCPQKICFTFGHITKKNEAIICLPLRMYITIISDTPSHPDELDAIVS